MDKLLTISDRQSGNLVLQKTCLIDLNNSGFTKNWFYKKLVLKKTSLRSRFCLSGFMAIWFYRKPSY
ncbi:hypothetical protein MYAER_1881 [Microcystis aeruginosa NIES-2549]|uniref:Uncharacterized protein n=1 Tax=Microcystis aeruginosa NIES-2549 TaxID=1641812 RepID=A0A0F6U403_MICAE|nr:hypothetical protein MYAER_1881 [Microcystis aeruginosa NIES-2549]AOC52623.1 hypothetical protein amyaer_1902 [Microcystis aeruginosa NIES-2481]